MALAGLLAAVAVAGSGDCAALRGVPLTDGEVRSAEVVGGICRVTATLRPSRDSDIGVVVWLPLSGWSGRYVQLGTGGFAGTIPTEALAHEAGRGNAVAVTDTGHVSHAFDATWARGHPEKVVDYGHRSLKVSADAAKTLTAAFYGRRAERSYFVGCSNGGRQALMAAQRWPQDWDGLLVGSPALGWTEQMTALAQIQQAVRAPGALIPSAKLPAIEAAARAQCDEGGQGRPCRLDVSKLGLTGRQAKALSKITTEFDARWASAPDGWSRWIVNPDRAERTQLTFAEQFFGQMVLQRTVFRVEELKPEDVRQATRLSPVLDANGGLEAFRRRGGRLIVYVGSADPLIAPFRALDYHQQHGGADFSRLYVAPGMGHCQGGAGPDAFGQSFVSPGKQADTRHDVRLALEAWVEQGHAPGELVAVKYGPERAITAQTVMRPQ